MKIYVSKITGEVITGSSKKEALKYYLKYEPTTRLKDVEIWWEETYRMRKEGRKYEKSNNRRTSR